MSTSCQKKTSEAWAQAATSSNRACFGMNMCRKIKNVETCPCIVLFWVLTWWIDAKAAPDLLGRLLGTNAARKWAPPGPAWGPMVAWCYGVMVSMVTFGCYQVHIPRTTGWRGNAILSHVALVPMLAETWGPLYQILRTASDPHT